MKCQATTYSHNLCPILTDIARVLMYSFRDQLQSVFLRFLAVLVHGSCILKLSGTGPVRGPSKKGNRTKTRPDFKTLKLMNTQFIHLLTWPSQLSLLWSTHCVDKLNCAGCHVSLKNVVSKYIY